VDLVADRQTGLCVPLVGGFDGFQWQPKVVLLSLVVLDEVAEPVLFEVDMDTTVNGPRRHPSTKKKTIQQRKAMTQIWQRVSDWTGYSCVCAAASLCLLQTHCSLPFVSVLITMPNCGFPILVAVTTFAPM
jgi:muconolactone delta-isomerase